MKEMQAVKKSSFAKIFVRKQTAPLKKMIIFATGSLRGPDGRQ